MNVSELVTNLIILLLVATGVALLSQRLRIPYVAGLVLAGLAIAELLPQKLGLNDSLILNVFLPILVFEASINTDVSRLRSTVKPIALLAGPGVLLASGITAMILKWGLGLGWIAALLAGVILAITDTVSMIAVFKEISVPSRLTTIVEGESLFNDGVALVLFSLILKVHDAGSITIVEGVQELLLVIIGGTLVGIALGYLSTGLFIRSDEPLSSILLTIAIALGAFQLGHILHVSGVVAVVVAGLIVGNIGLSGNISASTRLTLLSFWESASFGVNSFIFLLIGIEVKLGTLWQTLPAVLLAIIAYQIGRLISVYSVLALVPRFDRPVPIRWQHVLFVGNIKGSLSMALALSIPATIGERSQLISLIFGAVLLSLVVQGTSLPWLVKKLNLSRLSNSRQQVEEWQAQLMTSKAAQEELDNLLKTGILSRGIYEEMRASYQVKIASAEKSLREYYNRRPDEFDLKSGDLSKFDSLRRRLLLAEKGSLTEALRKRILSEEVAKERMRKIDEQLLSLEDD
ncbi:sodium:proton antiporter [Aphanothece hegewaldii CCALA 016]|uniref:Sodium:proton antiporter n=1 Tax=Aphanothece hegewaldii CCALA 016 TaxID=2107694 RepID=A0A2T1M3C1_9CHRO|nr:sodium:proton antiporter [Aphanothece hegewaldii]PSF39318.1 sodium:proton antiporter [Aphanothece hegewaldii CCALA 016]